MLQAKRAIKMEPLLLLWLTTCKFVDIQVPVLILKTLSSVMAIVSQSETMSVLKYCWELFESHLLTSFSYVGCNDF